MPARNFKEDIVVFFFSKKVVPDFLWILVAYKETLFSNFILFWPIQCLASNAQMPVNDTFAEEGGKDSQNGSKHILASCQNKGAYQRGGHSLATPLQQGRGGLSVITKTAR